MSEIEKSLDADYERDKDDMKSTSSYVFTLSNSFVCWKSQLQHIVTLSMIELKYIVTIEAIKEILWPKGLFYQLCILNDYVVVYSDGQSSINLCKSLVFHEHTNRIDVRLRFIRDIVS